MEALKLQGAEGYNNIVTHQLGEHTFPVEISMK